MLITAKTADAWNPDHTCNGTPTVWDPPFLFFTRHQCSIPDASDRADAYFRMIEETNQAAEDVAFASKVFPPDHCTGVFGDDVNDVQVVDRADIDGANGLTHVERTFCVTSDSIAEADVLVASDMPFDNPVNPTFLQGNHGRGAMLHEMLHAHGLGHEVTLSPMQANAPQPLIGGTGQHFALFGDDALGLRTIYPGASTMVNGAVSAHRVRTSDGAILENMPRVFATPAVCPGDVIPITFTVTNVGSSANFFFESISLVRATPTLIGFESAFFVDVGQSRTQTMSFSIPLSITTRPTGLTYLIQHESQVEVGAESRTFDDSVLEGAFVLVVPCP